MTTAKKFLAFDLGAESGRGIVGLLNGPKLELEVINRFPNEPVRALDALHWDVLALHRDMLQTLRLCAAAYAAWARENPQAAADFTTPEHRAQRGCQALVEADLRRMQGEESVTVFQKPRDPPVVLRLAHCPELTEQVSRLRRAAFLARRAAEGLLDVGGPQTESELRVLMRRYSRLVVDPDTQEQIITHALHEMADSGAFVIEVNGKGGVRWRKKTPAAAGGVCDRVWANREPRHDRAGACRSCRHL